jgi:hypothetical protein
MRKEKGDARVEPRLMPCMNREILWSKRMLQQRQILPQRANP